MTQKTKNELVNLLSGLVLVGTFALTISLRDNMNVYMVVGAPFGVWFLVYASLSKLIPVKKQKEKKKTPSQSQKINNYTYPNIRKNRLSSDEKILKMPFNQLSWREFERLLYLYYKSKGCKPRETKNGADGGVDLVYFSRTHNTDVAVQIKFYSPKNYVKVERVRELETAKRNYNCVLSEFITTSGYTTSATAQADNYRGMTLHSGEWVQNKIIKWKNEKAISVKKTS